MYATTTTIVKRQLLRNRIVSNQFYVKISIMFCYATALVCYSAFLLYITRLKCFLWQSSNRTPPSCSRYLNEWFTWLIVCRGLRNRNFSIYSGKFSSSISAEIQHTKDLICFVLQNFKGFSFQIASSLLQGHNNKIKFQTKDDVSIRPAGTVLKRLESTGNDNLKLRNDSTGAWTPGCDSVLS